VNFKRGIIIESLNNTEFFYFYQLFPIYFSVGLLRLRIQTLQDVSLPRLEFFEFVLVPPLTSPCSLVYKACARVGTLMLPYLISGLRYEEYIA